MSASLKGTTAMKQNQRKRSSLEQLQNKVYKITLSEDPDKRRDEKFDLRNFIKLAKQVKQTFKDEDITRLRSSIQAE